uniref:Uncharacterized protein n=1 Tax=Fundidesulfovibrio putealis TaxID=270496 RepID=A0A7C4EK44_9BACT
MQDLAAQYLEHFSLDMEQGAQVCLDQSAPVELQELSQLVCAMCGGDATVSLFEALSVCADSEMPYLAEVDEKVCPLDLYYVVLDYLGTHAFPTDGGV